MTVWDVKDGQVTEGDTVYVLKTINDIRWGDQATVIGIGTDRHALCLEIKRNGKIWIVGEIKCNFLNYVSLL